jgi:hypothetical protein
MTALDLLTHKLRKLTVDEFCWLAKVYECQDEELLYKTPAGKTDRITPAKLSAKPWEVMAFAKDCKVGFWGGPPGNENFYFGTLVTFAVDQILRAQVHQDIGFAWLLSFDSNNAKSIGVQIGHLRPDKLRQKTFWGTLENDECPFDNLVVDYVQIGENTYPIYEDGSQGCVVQRAGKAIPLRATAATDPAYDDGAVYPHSSSVRVGVRV